MTQLVHYGTFSIHSQHLAKWPAAPPEDAEEGGASKGLPSEEGVLPKGALPLPSAPTAAWGAQVGLLISNYNSIIVQPVEGHCCTVPVVPLFLSA